MARTTERRYSRRGLLKGAGVGAAGATVAAVCAPANVAPAPNSATPAATPVAIRVGPRAGSPGTALMRITVNGDLYETAVDPSWTLADLLRDQLGLTGTKLGCDRGECGSCTVVLDGRATLACMVIASEVADRTVLTVEGLAKGENLSTLQQSFWRTGAVQCGFCTPGMLMSASALLAANPKPSAEDARMAISGNMCRCTGYTKIVEAIVRASQA